MPGRWRRGGKQTESEIYQGMDQLAFLCFQPAGPSRRVSVRRGAGHPDRITVSEIVAASELIVYISYPILWLNGDLVDLRTAKNLCAEAAGAAGRAGGLRRQRDAGAVLREDLFAGFEFRLRNAGHPVAYHLYLRAGKEVSDRRRAAGQANPPCSI